MCGIDDFRSIGRCRGIHTYFRPVGQSRAVGPLCRNSENLRVGYHLAIVIIDHTYYPIVTHPNRCTQCAQRYGVGAVDVADIGFGFVDHIVEQLRSVGRNRRPQVTYVCPVGRELFGLPVYSNVKLAVFDAWNSGSGFQLLAGYPFRYEFPIVNG